ncbi:transferase [Streptomyces sp. NPDC014986]|uniref:transferase n=1 Tax=Streptomyces sp. NPDC014986 TaxID=3364934 RepID=UPI0036F67DE7
MSTVRTHCSVAADGTITFRLRPPADAPLRLLLVLRPKKGTPEGSTHTLGLEARGDDGEFHAVLEPRPPLAEGRWDAYLLRGTDTGRERLRPGLRDLRELVDGGTRERTSPVAVRVPYATKDGFLAIRTWLRTAHAEAGPLDVDGRTMTVRARLHGAGLPEGAELAVRPRGGEGTERTFPARPASGGAFRATVALAELAAGAAGTRFWDVFVRPGGGAPLIRVGRLLDDVADRKGVFVYPRVTVDGSAIRPYFTVDNDLAVEVTAPR